ETIVSHFFGCLRFYPPVVCASDADQKILRLDGSYQPGSNDSWHENSLFQHALLVRKIHRCQFRAVFEQESDAPQSRSNLAAELAGQRW
ncbi:MAG: hypothetical protein ABSH31_10080, partial [Bryobacteraceae bacterium]